MTLRNLLIQDWDLDEDARARHAAAAVRGPARWLADGQQIRIENAPTMFGPVSFHVESKLSDGYVEAHVTPPPRPAKKMLLRAPLPAGWQVESVEIDGASAPLLDGDSGRSFRSVTNPPSFGSKSSEHDWADCKTS